MQVKLSRNAIELILSKLRAFFGVVTDTELARCLGVKQNTVSSWKARGTMDFMLIIAKCDDIDLNWLFDGNDPQTDYADSKHSADQKKGPKNSNKKHDYKVGEHVSQVSDNHAHYEAGDPGVGAERKVPLFDMDTEKLSGLLHKRPKTPVRYIAIPDLPPCDGAVFVRGDAMLPLLRSGDIILYKQIKNLRRDILWGEMYLVSFDIGDELYWSVRYVQRSETDDAIRLVSENRQHSPQDVKLSRVRAMALVKASIRFNTMK